MSFMHRDVFTLRAEVIEVKEKPSHPVGEIMFDAFGAKPEYEDRGMRRRALLALGKVDYAFCDQLIPRDEGVAILGASSDHTILDIQDAARSIQVGDVLEFIPHYSNLVYLTQLAEHTDRVHLRNVRTDFYMIRSFCMRIRKTTCFQRGKSIEPQGTVRCFMMHILQNQYSYFTISEGDEYLHKKNIDKSIWRGGTM